MADLSTSAVIVTYNSSYEVDSCIRALIGDNADRLAEIVVVDNDSADNTCEIVEQHSGVRLIRNHVNTGFAAAVNQGVASSSGEYILVLNPDVVVTEDAISTLADALRQNEEYAAIGCRMVYPNGHSQISYRPFPTVTTFLRRAFFTNNVAGRARPLAEQG